MRLARRRCCVRRWRSGTEHPCASSPTRSSPRNRSKHCHSFRIDALEELAAAELAQGRWEEALSLVEVATDENRLRERLWELRSPWVCTGADAIPTRCASISGSARLLGRGAGTRPLPIDSAAQRADPPPRSRRSHRGAAGAPGSVRNPYKGLRPFAEEDAGDFFGRERLVAEILASLDAGSRLVALVGPSGCGKSSVLTAGLIPALRADALTGSAAWAIATMMPASQPFAQLERALATDGALRASEADGALLAAARPLVPADGSGRLLLAIDQFEELFTLTDEAMASRFLRHADRGRHGRRRMRHRHPHPEGELLRSSASPPGLRRAA